MAVTAVATLQAVWDCKWSRPGYRLSRVAEREQPETAWVCDRGDGHVPLPCLVELEGQRRRE